MLPISARAILAEMVAMVGKFNYPLRRVTSPLQATSIHPAAVAEVVLSPAGTVAMVEMRDRLASLRPEH